MSFFGKQNAITVNCVMSGNGTPNAQITVTFGTKSHAIKGEIYVDNFIANHIEPEREKDFRDGRLIRIDIPAWEARTYKIY